MIKEFKTTTGTTFKASFNFRANSIRVYELLVVSKKWYRSFLVTGLTSKEINDIAYNFDADEFKSFVIENEKSYIWR